MTNYSPELRERAGKIIEKYLEDISLQLKAHELRTRINSHDPIRMKLERINLAKDTSAHILKENQVDDGPLKDFIIAAVAILFKVMELKEI